MDSTMESTIGAKSETVISSDEEKQQVAQGPEVPEQQNLLEVIPLRCCYNCIELTSIALHQLARRRQF